MVHGCLLVFCLEKYRPDEVQNRCIFLKTYNYYFLKIPNTILDTVFISQKNRKTSLPLRFNLPRKIFFYEFKVEIKLQSGSHLEFS